MKVYRYFRYSTQVWLTSLFVSPALLAFVMTMTDPHAGFKERLAFTFIVLIYSSIVSIPNWLFLTGGVALIDRLPWSVTAKRLLVQLWAGFLTIGLFLVLFPFERWKGEEMVLPFIYLLTISFGVWNYSFSSDEDDL